MADDSTLVLYQVAVSARMQGDRPYDYEPELKVYGKSDEHARARAKRLVEACNVTAYSTEIRGREVTDYDNEAR